MRRMRVVVCGTTFGQVYLEGLQVPGLPFELAGILARGSERSHACATHYGVPLYKSIDELPPDIDIACVVVRGGLLGGHGIELSQGLMARGIHVLQEHPLHRDELAECLRSARRNRVVYHLNSFYVSLLPVRRFIAVARELFQRQQPVYVDAACGFQLLYSLLDILGQALGTVRPWALAQAGTIPDEVRGATEHEPVFRSLDGVLAGVPLTLRVQNQLHPGDPDNYAHLMHRVSLGTEGGNLTLVATHGPIVWTPRPHYPHAPRDPTSSPHFYSPSSEELALPSATVLDPAEAPTYVEMFRSLWPAGIARALFELRRAILAGDDGMRRGQHHLSVCQLWHEIGLRLGPPDHLHREAPRALTQEDLDALVATARKADVLA